MSLTSLLRQPVTVEHVEVSGVDALGNETTSALASSSTEAFVERTGGDEVSVDQATQRAEWTVFLPAGTIIDGGDRVLYGTVTLEVIGPPEPAFNPRTGLVSHLRCRARSVTG